MNIISNIIPNFLKYETIKNFVNTMFSHNVYILHFVVFNSPLIYTIYNNTFNLNIFIFSYLGCGLFQGIINTFLYYISDICFFGKIIDVEEWKKTNFYNLVIYNTTSTYLYILGSSAYISLTTVPEYMRWKLIKPSTNQLLLQFSLLIILHDIFFTLIHYIIHRVKYLRLNHLKWHHECPFNIGNSRCAIATEGVEGLIRDLYSAIIPTYIIGMCGIPFYGYIWILYYSLYSFWAMYIHTGVNIYHNLHHTSNSSRNYGLYYICDYFLGTLDLKCKKK